MIGIGEKMSTKTTAKRPAKKIAKMADDNARKDILRGLLKKTRFDKVRSMLEFNLQAGHAQDLQLPEGTVQIDDVDNSEAHSRIHMIIDSVVDQILTSGRPSVEVPKRSSSNIIYDEKNDLLLLGQETAIKAFHSLSSVTDITRLARVVQIIHDLLTEGIHGTKREIFYSDVDLFEEQGNSDAVIADASALLHLTRNSINIVASAKVVCLGRLRLRDKSDLIDCETLGSGGWGISPMLDNIEILESDAEFVLVVEKDAAVIRLPEDRWWKKN